MIYISLVRLPQRDEVTEGQGRRDGPVARNGTHQYVKWATCPSRSSDWFKLWRGRGWALGGHMCMIGRQLCVAHSQRCSTALVRSRARTSRLDFCAHPVCNQAPQCDIHQHKEVSADASDPGCEGRTHITWNNPSHRIWAILAIFPRPILREVEVFWYFWEGICFLYLESRNLGAMIFLQKWCPNQNKG